jgi:hypothetical protein
MVDDAADKGVRDTWTPLGGNQVANAFEVGKRALIKLNLE